MIRHLQAACPACGSTERVRAVGALVQHNEPRAAGTRAKRCRLSGEVPPPEAVRALESKAPMGPGLWTTQRLARTVIALRSREAMLSAQLAPLCELHDAVWDAARASGVTGAGATPATLLDAVRAQARREGAEAVREACARECRMVATMDTLSEVRPALYLEGRRRGADLCGEMIAALPLPGEEVPRDR